MASVAGAGYTYTYKGYSARQDSPPSVYTVEPVGVDTR